ncbi:unnamed protein product [Angiostrongylus costaricensis]|uniref:Neur_chan_memb domain-containing protein n=1 Tax=Angiostrongylus costaricensis TaxID=334426 RepID=A0A0R3Q0D5_ANGCS|nr:unnamed protein product [Angiostrongylus costaricensis]
MWSTPGLFRRLGVLWLMWFTAAFSSYSNDLNSNTISGNLFVNQILFSILLVTDTWLPKFSRRRLHHGAQFVVCICFLVLSILTLRQYTIETKGVNLDDVNILSAEFTEMDNFSSKHKPSVKTDEARRLDTFSLRFTERSPQTTTGISWHPLENRKEK